MSYSIEKHLQNSAESFNSMINLAGALEIIAKIVVEKLRNDAGVFWFGNGGSASDAEHLAAELSGRFAIDREPINSISLTCNTSVITAIANDYGYDQIFSRQVKGHVTSSDVVIGISTSGRSVNVLNGLQMAKSLGALTILFTGETFENTFGFNHVICAPSKNTANIQEVHIALGQALCGYIEFEMSH